MEDALRMALVAWLRDDPALAKQINSVGEEAAPAAAPPHLAIVASAAADWSTKDRAGREVRVALELVNRTDDAAATGDLAAAVERRVAAMMPEHDGFDLVSLHFLRSRSERRPRNLRAVLLEYRFRVLVRA